VDRDAAIKLLHAAASVGVRRYLIIDGDAVDLGEQNEPFRQLFCGVCGHPPNRLPVSACGDRAAEVVPKLIVGSTVVARSGGRGEGVCMVGFLGSVPVGSHEPGPVAGVGLGWR
jgi:hypothetical protein